MLNCSSILPTLRNCESDRYYPLPFIFLIRQHGSLLRTYVSGAKAFALFKQLRGYSLLTSAHSQTYSPADGHVPPHPCTPSQYSPAEGLLPPHPCTPHTYSPADGHLPPHPCIPSQYSLLERRKYLLSRLPWVPIYQQDLDFNLFFNNVAESGKKLISQNVIYTCILISK